MDTSFAQMNRMLQLLSTIDRVRDVYETPDDYRRHLEAERAKAEAKRKAKKENERNRKSNKKAKSRRKK